MLVEFQMIEMRGTGVKMSKHVAVILFCMLYVHLLGLAKEHKLIKIQGVRNFKILLIKFCWWRGCGGGDDRSLQFGKHDGIMYSKICTYRQVGEMMKPISASHINSSFWKSSFTQPSFVWYCKICFGVHSDIFRTQQPRRRLKSFTITKTKNSRLL